MKGLFLGPPTGANGVRLVGRGGTAIACCKNVLQVAISQFRRSGSQAVLKRLPSSSPQPLFRVSFAIDGAKL